MRYTSRFLLALGVAVILIACNRAPQEIEDELTPEIDAGIPTLQDVAIVKGRAKLQARAGTTVVHAITIQNRGSISDTYTITGTSTRGWADLNGFPLSVPLESDQTRTLSIKIPIPSAASPGEREQLTIKVTSKTVPHIFDSGDIIVEIIP